MQLQLTLYLEQGPPRNGYQKLTFHGGLLVPAMVVIAGAGTARSTEYAHRLHEELKAELQTLSLQLDETLDQVDDPLLEAQKAIPETQKLLVLVGEQGEDPPRKLHTNTTRLHEKWLSQGSPYSVMPIYPENSPVSELLPDLESLRKINVRFWHTSIVEAIPDVLAASGLTTREFRIFLSYRRWQTTALAHQLFSELNKYNFSVFLDQFRIEAGVNFQEKLIEDLADKSMVLLLESSDFLGSEWTREEIAFTKIHRLGLLALKVPDRGGGMPQIHPREREILDGTDFERGFREPADKDHPEANCLTPEALERVVARVRLEHGRAFLRRREQTRNEMTFALHQAGVPESDYDFTVGGFLRVRRPNHQYSIWLANRPPDLSDFHLSHLGCSPPQNAIIIGLSKYVAIERQRRMEWLTSVCHVRYFDEGQMSHIAEDIAKERM
jgi:hypothetical protein